MALELDITNGVVGGTASSNVAGGGPAGIPGTSASADLDTDIAGIFELKWLYVETPITGPGSLLPFIPVSTLIRAGAQPARGHDYKTGILFSGDFPGVTLETMWAPNLKSTITYAQLREQMDEAFGTPAGFAGGATESFALLTSVELEIFKGLTVKPTYAYARFDNGTGNTSLGSPGTGGFNPNNAKLVTNRHYIGGDVRWTSGPFSLQPTFYYLMGDQQCIAGVGGCRVTTDDIDINAWIIDVTGGFRTGPLNLEARVMYTPGQGATHDVRNGSDIGYYQGINPAFGYMAGWTEIHGSGIDYITTLMAGVPGVALRTAPSYDKYGRFFVGVAADYSLTPALTFHGVVNTQFTDEDVDTDGTLAAASGLTPAGRGDDNYLGTELNLGLTYRFAPNVAFDLMGGYLFAGDAMGQGGRDPEDVKKVASRIRVTW
jgi:hypothetical protein